MLARTTVISARRHTTPQALEGVRVLETGMVVAGPVVGTLLGDMGAEVIKCEEAAFGDTVRRAYPPLIDDISGYVLILARNKKSITLSLRMPRAGHPSGRTNW